MNRHWPDEPDMRRALSLRFLAFALTPTLVLPVDRQINW
jgi:hypothetical protein